MVRPAMIAVVLLLVVLSVSPSGAQDLPDLGPTVEEDTSTTLVPSSEIDEAVIVLPGEVDFKAGRAMLYSGETNVAEALQLLKKSADTGYASALTLLGTLYAFGVGVERSEERAVLHYQFAAMNGDIEAHEILAYRYKHGVGVEKSCHKAVEYAKVAADHVARGYSNGVRPLHQVTRLGDSEATASRKNEHKTLDILELQSSKGSADSAMYLGMAYLYGAHGAPQDGRRALEYFQQALKLGDAAAYGALGQIFSQGMPNADPPIKPNLNAAKKLFTEGAAHKHPTSLNGLGYLHAIGALQPPEKAGEKDWVSAAKYFKLSAQTMNAEGLYNLGVLYLNGRGVPRNFEAAKQRFETARHAGSVLARYQLGNMAYYNLGAARTSTCTVTLRHFEEVAERGHWRSRIDRAHAHYAKGEYQQALLDYLILAEQGNGAALHNAAYLLEHELADGIPLIPVRGSQHPQTPVQGGRQQQAGASSTPSRTASVAPSEIVDQEVRAHDIVYHALLLRALKIGQHSAHLKLAHNYWYGRGTQRDHRQAEEHYALAAAAGSAEGNFCLAQLYEEGTAHTRQDFLLAQRHYDLAVASDPNARVAVQLAFLRMNFRWWWRHFYGEAATTADAGDAKPDKPPSAADTEEEEPLSPPPSNEPQRWYEWLGGAVDRFTPVVLGYSLDTILLGVAFVLVLFVLHLRHHAAGQ